MESLSLFLYWNIKNGEIKYTFNKSLPLQNILFIHSLLLSENLKHINYL